MSEGTNYEALLNDLLDERANIDRMIAWARTKLAAMGDAPNLSQQPISTILPNFASIAPLKDLRFSRISSDQFFKMSVPEAIRAFLNIQKRPQSAKEITEGLKAGGFSHKAKDLYQTVFPTLMRMRAKSEVDKLANGEWGLSEWYSSGRRTDVEIARREPE